MNINIVSFEVDSKMFQMSRYVMYIRSRHCLNMSGQTVIFGVSAQLFCTPPGFICLCFSGIDLSSGDSDDTYIVSYLTFSASVLTHCHVKNSILGSSHDYSPYCYYVMLCVSSAWMESCRQQHWLCSGKMVHPSAARNTSPLTP